LLLAFLCGLPLGLYAIHSSLRLPWYFAFSIFAGELLLFYAAGFIGGLLMLFKHARPSQCPKCGSALLPAGRYIKNNEKSTREDLILFILFLAINAGLWVYLLGDPS